MQSENSKTPKYKGKVEEKPKEEFKTIWNRALNRRNSLYCPPNNLNQIRYYEKFFNDLPDKIPEKMTNSQFETSLKLNIEYLAKRFPITDEASLRSSTLWEIIPLLAATYILSLKKDYFHLDYCHPLVYAGRIQNLFANTHEELLHDCFMIHELNSAHLLNAKDFIRSTLEDSCDKNGYNETTVKNNFRPYTHFYKKAESIGFHHFLNQKDLFELDENTIKDTKSLYSADLHHLITEIGSSKSLHNLLNALPESDIFLSNCINRFYSISSLHITLYNVYLAITSLKITDNADSYNQTNIDNILKRLALINVYPYTSQQTHIAKEVTVYLQQLNLHDLELYTAPYLSETVYKLTSPNIYIDDELIYKDLSVTLLIQYIYTQLFEQLELCNYKNISRGSYIHDKQHLIAFYNAYPKKAFDNMDLTTLIENAMKEVRNKSLFKDHLKLGGIYTPNSCSDLLDLLESIEPKPKPLASY